VFEVRFNRVFGLRRSQRQFYALLVKHIIHSRRNIVLTVVQILLPIIFAIVACILQLVIKGSTDPPALPLNMSYFDTPVVPYSPGNALNSEAISLAGFYTAEARRYAGTETTNKYMDGYLLDVSSNLDTYNRYYLVAGTLIGGIISVLLFYFFVLEKCS
jgi:hypothetical protein